MPRKREIRTTFRILSHDKDTLYSYLNMQDPILTLKMFSGECSTSNRIWILNLSNDITSANATNREDIDITVTCPNIMYLVEVLRISNDITIRSLDMGLQFRGKHCGITSLHCKICRTLIKWCTIPVLWNRIKHNSGIQVATQLINNCHTDPVRTENLWKWYCSTEIWSPDQL